MSDWQIILNLHWYDRNPSVEVDSYSGLLVVPHSAETRLTYTVPTGKKAFVELLYAKILIGTIAESAGMRYAIWRYTKKDGSAKNIVYVNIRTNVAGDKDKHEIGQSMIMLEGDKLEGITGDSSIGGTVDYLLGYKITEFDANPPKDFIYIPDPQRKRDIQIAERKDPKM